MTTQTPSQVKPGLVLAAMGFAVFVAADDLTVVTTMLRPMIGDLGLTLPDGLDDAAWIVNVYIIAFVATMPIAGKLCDVIGRRKLIAAAYILFLVGTVIIAVSHSLGTFYVGRVMTAIGGGAMLPAALAVVADVYPVGKRTRALGTLGAIETVGWVWGPIYGAALVRFANWRWQFWLNVPLGLFGIALTWFALSGLDRQRASSKLRGERVDWVGAVALTIALVALNLALLGNSEVQSVSGFDELRGGTKIDFRLLYPVAALALAGFVVQQRRASNPLVPPEFFKGTAVKASLVVNFVVGAALVIAMVDIPVYINTIHTNLKDAATVSGWLLAAMTSAMAVFSWVGGRFGQHRTVAVIGLTAVTASLCFLGVVLEPGLSNITLGAGLIVLGAGLGLVFAPTTAVVVDAVDESQRGGAAALVMIARLVGLSVGLAALTAWALARFNALRQTVEVPAITDPGYQDALVEATASVTSAAVGETFLAAAALSFVGMIIATQLRPSQPDTDQNTSRTQ